MKCLLLIFFLFLFGNSSFATINIDSLIIKPSTCLNNGSVKIYASGTNAPFFYRLVSGPTTRLLQSADTFTSLASGNYLLRIYDSNFDSTQTNFIVGGNYQLPDFNLQFSDNYCQNSLNAFVNGTVINGTGNSPFQWTLFNLSNSTSTNNLTGNFSNLVSSNYVLRLSDSCNNYTSKAFSIKTVPSSAKYLSSSQYFSSCNNLVLYAAFNFTGSPITKGFIYTKNGVQSTNIVSSGNYINVSDTLYPIGTGDSVSIWLINNCADTFKTKIFVSPIIYKLKLTSKYVLCTLRYGVQPQFQVNLPVAPIIYHFRRYHYGVVTNYYDTSLSLSSNTYPADANDTIYSDAYDACGNYYSDSIIIFANTPQPSSYSLAINNWTCKDSMAFIRFTLSNFKSDVTIEFTSGPSIVKSTKSKYAFTDSLIYSNKFIASQSTFDIGGLGVGKYFFTIKDSCGNNFYDSISIGSSQVSNFTHSIKYKKSCFGANKIYINTPLYYPDSYTIIDYYSNSQIYYNNYYGGLDSVTNLSNGKYIVALDYTISGSHLNKSNLCTTIFDTLTIPNYAPPTITNYGIVNCNGNWYIDLLPDSTKGIAPFQYELISGPLISPLQNSSSFLFHLPGIYQARIVDACGNASTYSFTADTTFKFAVLQKGNLCGSGHVIFKCHSSPYFKYYWKYNNNLVHIGDSLLFNPFTMADTGLYKVTKYVNFHGCKDSTTVDLYLQKFYIEVLNESICIGDSFLWRNRYFKSSVNIIDTVIGVVSCDSFFHLNLKLNFPTFNLFNTSICAGEIYLSPSGKIFTSSLVFNDTIPNSRGCDSIITINLRVKNPSGSLIKSTICQNQNYTLPNGNTVNQSGIYIDTLTNFNGCDSIVKSYLTVLKINRDTVHTSICDNVMYQLPNGATTNVSGIYTDSFINYVGCDSIIITHLNVLQNPSISFPNFVPICLGNTISLNAFVPNATYQWNDLSTNSNHTFTNTGNYWVIISNPPCKADTANVSLNFIDCTCRMIAPNAFTPNDDGIDDLFKPMSTCDLNIINYHLKIYNRLGQLVFSTNDLNASWNGTYKSLPQEVSTYSYVVEWTNPTTNQIEITKGNLNLIR